MNKKKHKKYHKNNKEKICSRKKLTNNKLKKI